MVRAATAVVAVVIRAVLEVMGLQAGEERIGGPIGLGVGAARAKGNEGQAGGGSEQEGEDDGRGWGGRGGNDVAVNSQST